MCVLLSHFLRLTNARVDNPTPMINRGNFFPILSFLTENPDQCMFLGNCPPTSPQTWYYWNNYWMRFFVISRIIKGEVSVISRSRRLRLITLTYTLPILTYNFADFSVFSAYLSLSSTNISVSRSINWAIRALFIVHWVWAMWPRWPHDK